MTMTREQQYKKEIKEFLEQKYNAKPYRHYNLPAGAIVTQEGYFVAEFEETGRVRFSPSIDDFVRPYTYTCYIYFESEKGEKYFYLDGRKWNIHAIKTIKEIKEMLAFRFDGLTVIK